LKTGSRAQDKYVNSKPG